MNPKRHKHDGFKQDDSSKYMRLLVSMSACGSVNGNNAIKPQSCQWPQQNCDLSYSSNFLFISLQGSHPRSFYRHSQFLASIKDSDGHRDPSNQKKYACQHLLNLLVCFKQQRPFIYGRSNHPKMQPATLKTKMRYPKTSDHWWI